MSTLSRHAALRCQATGGGSALVEEILAHADIDVPIGDNCRLLRIHRRSARRLGGDDRLGRYAVIVSDRTGLAVTLMPLHDGPSGRRYRRTS